MDIEVHTLKDRYPLIPMERYVQWTGLNGEAFDPWIRVHARLRALQPVSIDRALDLGTYQDPNVWMRHPVVSTSTRR